MTPQRKERILTKLANLPMAPQGTSGGSAPPNLTLNKGVPGGEPGRPKGFVGSPPAKKWKHQYKWPKAHAKKFPGAMAKKSPGEMKRWQRSEPNEFHKVPAK